ncbi:MAG TPA: hypothetical protein VF980_19325 [Thermoanaerobaculia bacterium]
MPEHVPYDDDAIFNPETHHEKSDVSVRALVWFVVVFVVFGFVMHIVLWLLYKGYVRIEQRRNTATMTEMARPADMAVPRNQPLLQPFPRKTAAGEILPPNRSTPVTDLGGLRESEQHVLTTYGWVDQQKGIVRIPIAQAMQLTLQRGLPVQMQTATAAPQQPQPQKGAKR